MSAANFAAMGGITAGDLEAIARQYPNGCAGKYLEGGDRLREEINRCYSKIGVSGPPDGEPESDRRRTWHSMVAADPELTAGALRFANLILHHDDDGRHIRLSIRTAAAKLNVANSTMQDGREMLIARKWLIPTAIGSLALGRGPQVYGTPYAFIGNGNENEK